MTHVKFKFMVVCFMIFSNLESQEFNNKVHIWGVGLGISENYNLHDGATLNPSLILRCYKQYLSVSWKVFQRDDKIYQKSDMFYSPFDSKKGFNIEYKNNIYDLNARLRFNLLADISFSNFKRENNTTYSEATDQYGNGANKDAIYSLTQKYFAFSVGYGLDYKLINRFFLFHKLTCGFDTYQNNDKLVITERNYEVFNHTDKYFDNKGFSFITKIGLEYVF